MSRIKCLISSYRIRIFVVFLKQTFETSTNVVHQGTFYAIRASLVDINENLTREVHQLNIHKSQKN